MASGLNDSGATFYFYGVSRGGARQLPHALRGIDAIGAVESRSCSGLTCWYSRVDRGEYGERLEQNMQNLEWLANASVHHQRVVGSIAEIADILPARFGTVFLGDQSMAAHVSERKAALAGALRKIEGASEWGVKVFAEAPAVPAPSPATSGTDYLLKKREQLRQGTPPSAPAELGELKTALDKASTAAVVVRGKAPQPGLVWQASFLVKQNRIDAFHEVLRKFAARMGNARIETSGPWPPYSFAGVPQEAQAGERKPARAARSPRPVATKQRRQKPAKKKAGARRHRK